MPTTDVGIPVTPILDESTEFAPTRAGIGLCLSGGGYRAMLFHLGALWRLNEFGYLPRLARVSSVSGGSITAGMLGVAWASLAFDDAEVGQAFVPEVVDPIRKLASKTIDVPSVIGGIFGRGNASDKVADAYREHLFGDRTLQALPDANTGPRFVFNASNLQSGALVRFSKPYIWDYRVGQILNPEIDIAIAVAASSAFPPVLSPTVLKVEPSDFTPGTGTDLQRKPFTSKMQLTDGGVYDNLGLETVWKNYGTVLVSDGGGKTGEEESIEKDPLRHTLRVLNLIHGQVGSLRIRQLIDSYQLPENDTNHRKGTYWGMRTDLADYHISGKLPCPVEQTLKLARTPTRLAKLDNRQQERIINWGYAACDATMRTWVDRDLPAPDGFPYPDSKVG